MMARRTAALVALLVAGCGPGTAPAPSPEPLVVHLGDAVDAHGEGAVDVAFAEGARTVAIHLDGEPRIVEVTVTGADQASLEGEPGEALMGIGVWHRPVPRTEEVLWLEVDDAARTATIFARGAPVPGARRERSLVWTDPAVVDDPAIVGLARVLAAASDDGHGGVLLERWFRRFATTAHSERAGPAQLIDEIAAVQGADPARWDLDALPFKVTGVHNRIDLAARGGACGELRVSFASTHPIYAPLHLLFLFRQDPGPADTAPDGNVHCLATARRWSRLAALDGADFVAAARAWLDEALVRERFVLAETVELTVSPWEWRQWQPVGTDELDNPALFQTVATPELNAPGSLRDAFLAFVEQNKAELAARTAIIPAAFRAASARVPPSAPAERLSLAGLDTSGYPDLALAIEIVGCPTCHTHDANFVQTNPDRTFSPFYDRELDARAARLDALGQGTPLGPPPFGPLQDLAGD